MLTVDQDTPGKTMASRGRMHHGVGSEATIVVEFVGPTGGGKTTNCQSFSDLLKKKNLKVAVFSDLKKYFYGQKYSRRFYIFLNTIRIHGVDFLKYTLLLAFHGIYSFDALYRYIKLCVFNAALQDFVRTQTIDIVLLDQWSIQGLWSATIFNLKSHRKLQEKLRKFYFQTDYVLYFDIDAVTASERIGARNTGRSRFDKMSLEKRMAEFEKHNGYLFELYKNSNCGNKYVFSTLESPVKNAETFLAFLSPLATKT